MRRSRQRACSGGEKVAEISRLLNRGNLNLLLEEIDKCDVICANCHRIRTWNRENNADVVQRQDVSLPS